MTEPSDENDVYCIADYHQHVDDEETEDSSIRVLRGVAERLTE